MGFNPGTGMTPNDWSEQEARRAERVQRADKPHGREMSPRSRRITGCSWDSLRWRSSCTPSSRGPASSLRRLNAHLGGDVPTARA